MLKMPSLYVWPLAPEKFRPQRGRLQSQATRGGAPVATCETSHMIEEDIHQLIEQELRESSNWAVPTKPEILSRLVPPRKMSFLVDLDWNQSLDLWLVYENTDDGFEFKVVYNETTGKFGLAISLVGFNRDLVLGFYTSFQDTLREFDLSDIDHL